MLTSNPITKFQMHFINIFVVFFSPTFSNFCSQLLQRKKFQTYQILLYIFIYFFTVLSRAIGNSEKNKKYNYRVNYYNEMGQSMIQHDPIPTPTKKNKKIKKKLIGVHEMMTHGAREPKTPLVKLLQHAACVNVDINITSMGVEATAT